MDMRSFAAGRVQVNHDRSGIAPGKTLVLEPSRRELPALELEPLPADPAAIAAALRGVGARFRPGEQIGLRALTTGLPPADPGREAALVEAWLAKGFPPEEIGDQSTRGTLLYELHHRPTYCKVGTDIPELVAWVQEAAGYPGVNCYVCPNPIRADYDPAKKGRFGEADIARWANIIADFDTLRPGHEDSPATDEELAHTRAFGARVMADFQERFGFPANLRRLLSGNGLQYYIPCDLPNDTATGKLIQAALAAAARLHPSDGRCKIDTSMGDAPQLARLAGAQNRKPLPTADRPNRMARVEVEGDRGDLLTVASLEALVAAAPAPGPAPSPRRARGAGEPREHREAREGLPGDEFNERGSWEDVFAGTRWTQTAKLPDGEERWSRPGKAGGTSATAGHGGRGILHVFSDAEEVAPFEAGGNYSKFHAYALLHWKRDHGAAARALRERGYGAEEELLPGRRSKFEPRPARPRKVIKEAPAPIPAEVMPALVEAIPPLVEGAVELNAYGAAVRAHLEKGTGLAFLPAPTGQGKTTQAALAICQSKAENPEARFIWVTPSRRLAKELIRAVRTHGARDGVRNLTTRGGRKRAERGTYGLRAEDWLVVICHEQFRRRGFSRHMRPTWGFTRDGWAGGAPPTIVIDELAQFVASLEITVPLASRTKKGGRAGDDTTAHLAVSRCPASEKSGNCGNCALQTIGSIREIDDTYGIPQIRPAGGFKEYPAGSYRSEATLRTTAPPPQNTITFAAFVSRLRPKFGESVTIGGTLRVTPVLEIQGERIGELAAAEPPAIWEGEKVAGAMPSATSVLGELLRRSEPGQVRLCVEAPVGRDPEEMGMELRLCSGPTDAHRKERERLHEGFEPPFGPCGVPTLRFPDPDAIRMLAALQEVRSRGVVGLGANLPATLAGRLARAGAPAEVVEPVVARRKMRRCAIAFVDEARYRIDTEGGLPTDPLLAHGEALVFLGRKEDLDKFQEAADEVSGDREDLVGRGHGIRYIRENNSEVAADDDDSDRDVTSLGYMGTESTARTTIAYLRGVCSVGINLSGDLVAVLLDAKAFRHFTRMNPDELTEEAYRADRIEEVVELLSQAAGRLNRGHPGKLGVLLVFNTRTTGEDEATRARRAEEMGVVIARLRAHPAFSEGAERPPVIGDFRTLDQGVEACAAWLAGGGEADVLVSAEANRERAAALAARRDPEFAKRWEDAREKEQDWQEFAKNSYRHLKRLKLVGLDGDGGVRKELEAMFRRGE